MILEVYCTPLTKIHGPDWNPDEKEFELAEHPTTHKLHIASRYVMHFTEAYYSWYEDGEKFKQLGSVTRIQGFEEKLLVFLPPEKLSERMEPWNIEAWKNEEAKTT